MSWQQLLSNRRLQQHQTSRHELDELWAVVEHDLQDAALESLSTDRRFATAYNAVLQLAKMVIACAGYRVAARAGHHLTTFEALQLALGKDHTDLVDYFDTCRWKRNQIDYDMAGVVSETEATELRQKASQFRQLVEQWIRVNHPRLYTN